MINADQARVVAEVRVGISPHGVDYRAQRLYVANEGAGTISVLAVEGERVSTVTTINAGAGTRQVRIDATGQIGVASNSRANTLTLFDTPTNRVIQTIKTGGAPDGIAFLENYAVVRNGLTPNATFVHLDKPDVADEVALGEVAPLSDLAPTEHARLFVSSAGDEVSVPSPGDGQVYHLHVMDGRPMAMSQTKVEGGTDMIFSLVNHVHEISPGVYQRIVQFDREDMYTLNVDLSASKSPVQFSFNVVSTAPTSPWMLQPIQPAQPYVAGKEAIVQYRILNAQTPSAEPIRDGVITLYRFIPGQATWQQILPAEYAGDNIYQARIIFPEAGAYAMTFNSPKSGLAATDSPRATVQVVSR